MYIVHEYIHVHIHLLEQKLNMNRNRNGNMNMNMHKCVTFSCTSTVNIWTYTKDMTFSCMSSCSQMNKNNLYKVHKHVHFYVQLHLHTLMWTLKNHQRHLAKVRSFQPYHFQPAVNSCNSPFNENKMLYLERSGLNLNVFVSIQYYLD
jgi:hypothetical protein